MTERCWSGRTGTPGKRVGAQVSRGFESRPLRQNNLEGRQLENTKGLTNLLGIRVFWRYGN